MTRIIHSAYRGAREAARLRAVWERTEGERAVEQTCENGFCADEAHESNRLREAFPAGAHPTAGAPLAYLEDETR